MTTPQTLTAAKDSDDLRPERHDGPSIAARAELGAVLRAARNKKGISPTAAAQLAGISPSLLAFIERGEHVLTSLSSGNLAHLHRAFGMTWEQFLSVILPVYGEFLPYLQSDRRVARSRRLAYPGSVRNGLGGPQYSAGMTATFPIPDYDAIASYADDDLMVLRVTPDSLACAQARMTVPQGSHAIFQTQLTPQAGDVVAVWLDREGIGALELYRPEHQHVVLESYDGQQPPVVSRGDGAVRGVYVGHLSSGRRAVSLKH